MSILRNRKFEYILFMLVIFLSFFGIISMYSASSDYAIRMFGNERYFFDKQLIFIIIGIIVSIVVSFINYKIYDKLSFLFYIFALVLIIMTFFIGTIGKGSMRWIQIRGINLQTSEIMKTAIIIFMSSYVYKNLLNIEKKETILIISLITLIPTIIISINNLSTAIIVFLISFSIYYVSSKKIVPFVIALIILIIFYLFADTIAHIFNEIGLLKDYQLIRIFAWKDPLSYQDVYFQTIQGLYAVGSGGLIGRGLGESLQKTIMPEPQNDMVFSIICEELGLFGAVIFILLYLIIIIRIIYIAMKQHDVFATLVCYGIAIHISVQALLNIAVVLNLIPNTGVSLPFVSYGGSSMLVLFFEIGIVMNISKNI